MFLTLIRREPMILPSVAPMGVGEVEASRPAEARGAESANNKARLAVGLR
jgi:hypothetical protein